MLIKEKKIWKTVKDQSIFELKFVIFVTKDPRGSFGVQKCSMSNNISVISPESFRMYLN